MTLTKKINEQQSRYVKNWLKENLFTSSVLPRKRDKPGSMDQLKRFMSDLINMRHKLTKSMTLTQKINERERRYVKTVFGSLGKLVYSFFAP